MASSDSNWRNGSQNQGGDDGYNRRNKNPNRGKNRRYNQQWKPKPQGIFGEGDGPPAANGGKAQQGQEQRQDGSVNNSNQKSSFSPTTSSSSSGSGSSSSPSTVVSQSPKSDSSGEIKPTTPSNLDATIDLVTPDSSASESFDGSHVLSDSNGNKSNEGNIVNSNHANSSQIEPTKEIPGSPPFESASENEDEEPEKNTTQSLEPKNGHSQHAQAKSASTSSFVELADSEEEESKEAVTHASLVVNLTDNKSPAINIKRFTTSPSTSTSDSPSPLTSSRSAPPDVSGKQEDVMENVTVAQAQAQFTTPPAAVTSGASDGVERLSPEFPPDSKPYSAKKKNSVSFAPNTIDIEEVILGRPAGTPNTAAAAAVNPNANRPAVSPSILINGASGGGNISSEINWQSPSSGSDSEDDDDDEDSAATVTYNDLSEAKVVPNAQAQGGDGVDDLAADEEVKEINSVSELPVTATELVAPNGVKVYVVGTAHFSVKSQQDVIETIQKVQPNVVVLELCQSRRNILTLDEETILREASDLNFEKVRLAIRQSGAVQGMLHLLLLSMSAQITKKLGMAPGGEFRVGLHEASKIHNCMIYLGDRPFGITLSRALNALTLKQKIKLCWQFMTNNEDITKEEIERCKEKDLLEKMLIEMMGEYPSISQVFVHERDVYLAHSLWGAALSAHASVCHNRDHGHPAGETGTVVGVVGMGHVAGIIKHWGKTTEEQISEITIVPEPSLQSRIIRKTIKISFYALLGYGTYKLSRKLFDFPSDALISRAVKEVPELVNKPLSMFKK